MRHLDEQQTRAQLGEYRLDRPQGLAFAFRDPARQTFYDWHAHPYHQLLYATAGTTQIETGRARYLLPTGRAAWIPAGVRHRTLVGAFEAASLYFAPAAVADDSGRVRILVASAVMREMVLHALRWPQGASDTDPVARSFFRTLALLCGEWLDSELPLSLPSAAHRGLRRAMDEALADPGATTLARALATAAMSERSFRRRFLHETGLGWQDWLTQARILDAASRLTGGATVTQAALDAGYRSLSAFAKAFARLTGESPAAYRRRTRRPK